MRESNHMRDITHLYPTLCFLWLPVAYWDNLRHTVFCASPRYIMYHEMTLNLAIVSIVVDHNLYKDN